MQESTHRQQIASLAHAKAHEVVALREALGLVKGDMDAAAFQQVLRDMIADREAQVSMMGGEVAGHA